MAIDWARSELAFLRSQLAIGRVVLFAGAGFSLGATNKFGDALPLGTTLATLLANKAGVQHHGESLPLVYEAVEPLLGTKNLWTYLSELYSVVEYDEWYKVVTSVTWFRIYTTNIDNLFQTIKPLSSGQALDTIVRGDPPQERDPHFERLQCVHLHGHIQYRSNGVSFTLPDLAGHTARPDPWYQSLVDDIYTSPTLFIGSSLEEPILTHYLELREQKPTDAAREIRPKSFLVAPNVGPIRAESLKRRNIAVIDATAQEFFSSLRAEMDMLSLSVRSVQATVWPHLFGEARRIGSSLARDFDPIIPDALPTTYHGSESRFFLGAEPTWDDMHYNRDAPREINTSLFTEIASATGDFKCIVLHGPAGSGKSTSLMRTAISLAEHGHQVYCSKSIDRLSLDAVLALAENLQATGQRITLMIDVVSRHIGALSSHHDELLRRNNLTLVLADRTNRYASRCQQVVALSPVEISMPDLSKPDVDSILERLSHFGFLGALRNKTHDEQVHEFMVRAKKQILVAMREATSGKDFDAILQGEFGELTQDARLAYTICCIAIAKGAPGVYRKHLMPCIPNTRFTKGVIIDDLLRGVLVPGNATGTLLKPRHGVIAQLIANEVAPLPLRYEAITTFLIQVSSSVVPNEMRRRSPPFLAYRGMVNSEGLFELFGGDMRTILDLYEEVRPYFDGDFLFWLQYAMAHIRAGNLDIAENFLNQSLNIRDGARNHQALHQIGILYILQAIRSASSTAMKDRVEKGMDILRDQMRTRGDHDSYPYHAYLTYVGRWYTHAGGIISQSEWEELRAVGKEASAKYRLDDTVRDAVKEVEHRYLTKAIQKPGERAE